MTNLVIAGQRTSLRFIAVRKYQALGQERLLARKASKPDVVAQLTAQMQRINLLINPRSIRKRL